MKKSKQDKTVSKSEREDRIEFEGEIVESLPGTLFKVEIPGGTQILAGLAGRLRQNKIRILVGDQVKCEVSPYDLSRGRITWRKS